MNHLAIDNLTFAYTPKHPTLKDVALRIPVDSWTLFYGASGSGKSTLMRLLAGLLPKYGGRILQGNIKLPNADTYSVDFTFHSPEDNGYLLHTDAETGPGGSFDDYFKDGPITVHYDGWDYAPQEW